MTAPRRAAHASALRGVGLLLAPGAGSSSGHPALVAIDRQVTNLGGLVERIDFPYRLAGRRSPDRMPVLLGAFEKAVSAFADRHGPVVERLYVGGRSMGGRVASMAVAAGLPAAGLVLVSYPLHPPGRPHHLRTEHFPALSVPCLFISGSRDPFGSPAELEEALKAVPGKASSHWMEGGDHSLRGRDADVAAEVASWLTRGPTTGRSPRKRPSPAPTARR